jgi:anaerobic magnesium-protoporphyrin IX monomethyl ester cyclase
VRITDRQPPTPNRGTRVGVRLAPPRFPRADEAVQVATEARAGGAVDILFVNPPAPDRSIWIRSQHRVGRRSREGMIWPQVGLAQMAALFPDYRVGIIDAIPHRMTWETFERLLREKRPRIYVTQVTAPTLQNDMYGVFLARSLGATTIAFGTHVTPMPQATMEAYPALDFVLRGEPELTLRELADTLERRSGKPQIPNPKLQSPDSGLQGWWPEVELEFRQRLHKLFVEADPGWRPAWLNMETATGQIAARRHLKSIKGLVWRHNGEIVINPDRPFIRSLDDLPLPRHDLLPLDKYRAPLVRGPYAFVVTSRGCPGGCRFCIKHVSYDDTVRFRSPEDVLAEIEQLVSLGVRDVHMYADLFTLNRDHVMGICREILSRRLKVRWTCNSRVDFVDEEMLRMMAHAGCWMIAWGIESGDAEMLRRMGKGTTTDQAEQALRRAKQAGIMNWGYFIIGLPGETEESIRRTIDFARRLPLDLALFHIAAPHPGTPFFFEVVENGWFRPGTRWEDVDMDRSTVLDYPHLRAEELEKWARRAFREWAFRPAPIWTYLKMLLGSPSLWRPALEIGLASLGWAQG